MKCAPSVSANHWVLPWSVHLERLLAREQSKMTLSPHWLNSIFLLWIGARLPYASLEANWRPKGLSPHWLDSIIFPAFDWSTSPICFSKANWRLKQRPILCGGASKVDRTLLQWNTTVVSGDEQIHVENNYFENIFVPLTSEWPYIYIECHCGISCSVGACWSKITKKGQQNTREGNKTKEVNKRETPNPKRKSKCKGGILQWYH